MLGALPIKLAVARIAEGERAQNRLGPTYAGGVLMLEPCAQGIPSRCHAGLQHITVTLALGGDAQVDFNPAPKGLPNDTALRVPPTA